MRILSLVRMFNEFIFFYSRVFSSPVQMTKPTTDMLTLIFSLLRTSHFHWSAKFLQADNGAKKYVRNISLQFLTYLENPYFVSLSSHYQIYLKC